MFKKLLICLILIFLIQCLLAGFILFTIGKNEIEKDLRNKVTRAQEDIVYNDNQWNIDRYNSDPQLLGNYPLYIITTDGFVLDRRNPIKGFLDSANFDNLLAYETPQTITSITGNTRRILSKIIKSKNDDILALVAVSYLEPQEPALDTIDRKLLETTDLIISKIQINDKTIDTNRVDERDIPYEISFLIVDNYNDSLLKSTNVNNRKRIPSFVDPSYVKSSLDGPRLRIIRDTETNDRFLVLTEPIKKNNQTLGVISVGSSLENILSTIKDLVLWFGLFNLLVFTVIVVLFHRFLKQTTKKTNPSQAPSKIRFDTKHSILFIDQHQIEVAYASNQYYLLRSLFSNPLKRFETDQLLEEFGEISIKTDSRKVYDTMTNINKKVAGYLRGKLIINQNKTYQLNPHLPIEKVKK